MGRRRHQNPDARAFKVRKPYIGLQPLEPRRLFSASLVNGSFEDGLTGWTELGGSNYVVDDHGGVTDGNTALRLNSSSDVSDVVIAQSISTEVGQRYDVTFDYGSSGNSSSRGQELRFEARGGGDLITTQDYSVANSAGFVTYTFSFVATHDETELRISDITTESNAVNLDGVLDNLQVSESLYLEPQINNPGFEAREVGWVFADDSRYEFRSDRDQTEGDLAIAFNDGNVAGSAVVSQTLNTEVGTTYQIGFDYGLYGTSAYFDRVQELRFEALDADFVLASNDYEATGSDDRTAHTFTFIATATTTELRISDLTTKDNSFRNDGVLDNLTIAAINRAPVDLSFSGVGGESVVDENVDPGTLLGQFITTDFDAGDTATYSLLSGDTDLLQIVGDQLVTLGSFDFDTQPTLTAAVRSTDGQGATIDRTFTIQVNEVNSPPVGIAFSGSEVDENVAAGTPLGLLTTTDPDPEDTHTYTLVSGDTDLLQIVGDELVTLGTFDFDTQPTLTAVVRSTDSAGATVDQTFIVQVNEIISPFFTVSLNPGSFDRSAAIDQTETSRGVADDVDRVDLTASTTDGNTSASTRFVSSAVPAADPSSELVERLADAATSTGFLPLSVTAAPDADASASTTDAEPAEPVEPGALPQIQPVEVTLAATPRPSHTFNPWLVGVDAAHGGLYTPDPVTAWVAWFDGRHQRNADDPTPTFADPVIRMTEVPTGP